jgi:hypothetical protein
LDTRIVSSNELGCGQSAGLSNLSLVQRLDIAVNKVSPEFQRPKRGESLQSCFEFQEIANERIVRLPEELVGTFEDNSALVQHHNLRVNQTQFIAFVIYFQLVGFALVAVRLLAPGGGDVL